MSNNEIVSGDDIIIEQTLTKDNATFSIDSSATIKASLVSIDRKTIFVAPVSVLEAATGSDWANSKVIVIFAEADTSSLTTFGSMLLEVQVDDGGKLTWLNRVVMLQGTIDQ